MHNVGWRRSEGVSKIILSVKQETRSRKSVTVIAAPCAARYLRNTDAAVAPGPIMRAQLGVIYHDRCALEPQDSRRDQVPYLWLVGMRSRHNTRKAHRDRMRTLCAHRCLGTIQAVDGTRIAANAGTRHTHDAQGLQRLLARTEQAIADLEAQNATGGDAPPAAAGTCRRCGPAGGWTTRWPASRLRTGRATRT